MSRQSVSLLLIAMLLIGNIGTLNWQGTGNLTQDNITAIWTYINTNFDKSWTFGTLTTPTDTKIADFVRGLSDHLNGLWDRAWNVVVIYYGDFRNADAVLYGYGFRDHWMWYNGFQMADNLYVSFVIWKDYNCFQWINFNFNTMSSGQYPTSYTDSNAINQVKNALSSLSSSADRDQIWLAAQAFVNKLESDAAVAGALGNDKAFSVVVTQNQYGFIYGHFCVKDYMLKIPVIGSVPYTWGRMLVLQMR